MNTYYVKVHGVVIPDGAMYVIGDKPWVDQGGNLNIGNPTRSVETATVIPAANWIAVWAVDPITLQPLDVIIPTN